jgi:hypothetical protein
MPRVIETKTLDNAALYYAGCFLQNRGRFNRDWVVGQMYSFTYRDEFDHIVAAVKNNLAGQAKADFNSAGLNRFEPRTDEVFEAMLREKLAIDPDGRHIVGQIGRVIVGSRLMGRHMIEVEAPWSIRRRKALGLPKTPANRELMQKLVPLYWPVYAGETDERLAGNIGPGGADPLPDGTPGMPVGATNTFISNECALLGLNAIVDNLDEGAGAAVIQGRSGTQPADADTSTTGTLLFTLVCSDPAFGNAADDTPGAIATADAIADDSSADATGTLGYCRGSSTADGATPADDHIDGSVGTSDADFIFNTLSIVSGATIAMSSWTVSLPESGS